MDISLLIRKAEGYPYHAVRNGLLHHGHMVTPKYPPEAAPRTLLVTWTLWAHSYKRIIADKHYNAGGRTLCMENAWVNALNRKYYQLAERSNKTPGINGWGEFPVEPDEGERWRSFGVKLQPWQRVNEGFILVCPQRGVRETDPDITHGPSWTESIVKRLRKLTDRPIHWRPHPGAPGKATLPNAKHNDVTVVSPLLPLSEAVRGAHMVVVYSSTAASEAIVQGIPIAYDGPMIMTKDLATPLNELETPRYPEREPVLHKLAYAQWSLEELTSGEAFSRYVSSISP